MLLSCLLVLSLQALPQASPPVEVRLVAVGDILMHEDVKRAANALPDRFRGLWAGVEPLLQGSDLAFANLETALAPATGRPGAPYVFNAPAEVAFALRASGFTHLSTANNHAFDQGPQGVAETLDNLGAAGLVAVGSGRTREAAERAVIVERQGIRIALLAFTEVLNTSFNRQPNEPWVRGLEAESALRAVRAAREGADVVVVSLHWGSEYAAGPSDKQRRLALRLVGAGADLILGHHPHVLGPVERLQAEGRTGFVAYTLGNFISNQDRVYRPASQPPAAGDSRNGAALIVTFTRTPQGVAPTRVQLEPLWTENNWVERQKGPNRTPRIRVLALNAAIDGARADLARATAREPADPVLLAEAAARVKLLCERRDRIRELMRLD
jgi:hypothetical protein